MLSLENSKEVSLRRGEDQAVAGDACYILLFSIADTYHI